MDFNNVFSGFLLVCVLQTFIIILLLTLKKKYRRIPNLFLLALFILFLIHYSFYLFEYRGFFSLDYFRASAILPFQLLPPVLVYLYVHTRVHGNITGARALLKHLVAFILGVVFFIPIIIDSFSVSDNSAFFTFYSHVYRIVFSFVIVSIYIIYSTKIVTLFAEYNNCMRVNFFQDLINLPKKVRIVSVVVVLLFFNALCFLLEFVSIFVGNVHKYVDFLSSAALFVLSFVLSFIFTKNPKSELAWRHVKLDNWGET